VSFNHLSRAGTERKLINLYFSRCPVAQNAFHRDSLVRDASISSSTDHNDPPSALPSSAGTCHYQTRRLSRLLDLSLRIRISRRAYGSFHSVSRKHLHRHLSVFDSDTKLKQIFGNQHIDHIEEYYGKGATYLRVFMAGQKDGAWDGLRTVEALTLINKAPDATWNRT
jgi:hypothetical protein